MRDDVLIIICSTPYSKRLPQKCFLKIAGKPVLQHIFDRVKPLDIGAILAIPSNTTSEYKSRLDIPTFVNIIEGSPGSPLHRIVSCLLKLKRILGFNPKYIIRITHDDMLIDPATVQMLLDEVIEQNAGYGITPTIVEGAGVEIIATENIINALSNHPEPVEHISYFVKGENCPNPKIIKMKPRESIERDYRLTLDYYEDYVVLAAVLQHLGSDASVNDICKYLDDNTYILDYNKQPEVSIYTCVRNGGKWIIETMLNIPLRNKNHEYIVVDDASTDDTLKNILELKNVDVIVNTKNIGLASSSNRAVLQARGKYIMRVDCDDILLGVKEEAPQAIDIMKLKLEETGAVICYANYNEINESGETIRENVSAKEHHHIGCALVNKRWLNEIRFKEGIRHWDGLELYNRIKGRFPIAYVDEPLWYYRVRQNSMSRTNLQEREQCKPK